MIIKIDESNQARYNEFFEQAYADAKAQEIDVPDGQSAFSSLWEYYSYLPQLARKLPVYYTKLPLDEPMMEINGDTREVKVPAQLVKCAGIENDHYAESIMFLIDRYHDGQDLMNSQIWIQWKAADGTEDCDNVPTMDADFTQNKIRFPWPLTSKVTSHPGIIEFSVVFFAKDLNQQLVYRYSTLTSKIRIEPALKAELGNNANDVGAGFAAAVRTNNYGPGFYKPVRPYFDPAQGGIDLVLYSDLDYTDATDFGALTLQAQATVTDTGSVSYQWKHKVPEGSIEFNCGASQQKTLSSGTYITKAEKDFITAYANSSSLTTFNNKFNSETNLLSGDVTITYSFGAVSLVSREINKANINDFDRYYSTAAKAIDGSKDEYMTKEDFEDFEGDKVYERISQFILPEGISGKDQPVTGIYYAVAVNQIKYTEGSETKTKESFEAISTQTTLISPQELNFTDVASNTIEFTDEDSIKLDTKLDIVEGENYVAAIAKVTTSSGDLPSEYATATASGVTKNADSQNVDTDGKIEIFKVTDSGKPYSSGIGWYQAEISSKRNRETKKGVTKIWRVVNPVAVPKITHNITELGSLISEITESEDHLFTVEINNATNSYPSVTLAVKFETEGDVAAYYGNATFGSSLYSDGYNVNWQKITSDKITPIECTELEYTVPSNDWTLGTRYKCTIVNTLNGKTASGDITFELR